MLCTWWFPRRQTSLFLFGFLMLLCYESKTWGVYPTCFTLPVKYIYLMVFLYGDIMKFALFYICIIVQVKWSVFWLKVKWSVFWLKMFFILIGLWCYCFLSFLFVISNHFIISTNKKICKLLGLNSWQI